MQTTVSIAPFLLKETLSKNIKLLVLDGGTCSGKTTITNELLRLLKKKNIPYTFLSVDMFLMPREERDYGNNLYKNTSLIRWYYFDKFTNLVDKLLSSSSLEKEVSIYNRDTGNVDLVYNISHKNGLIILEGLYVLHALVQSQLFPTIDNKLLFFFETSPTKMEERMKNRNVYIKDGVFDLLCKNVYIPSHVDYINWLNNEEIVFDRIFFTDNFDDIKIRESSALKGYKD